MSKIPLFEVMSVDGDGELAGDSPSSGVGYVTFSEIILPENASMDALYAKLKKLILNSNIEDNKILLNAVAGLTPVYHMDGDEAYTEGRKVYDYYELVLSGTADVIKVVMGFADNEDFVNGDTDFMIEETNVDLINKILHNRE
jgi:hypothetical protein